MLLQNGAEGGANGVTVTTGNSGGASGNAFDNVTIGTGATVTYDNAHTLDSMAIKMLSGSTGTFVAWTSGSVGTLTQVWGRLYLYLTANPATELALVRFRQGATQCGRIAITSGGLVVLRNSANGIIATGAVVISKNQWVRIEFRCQASTTVGQIEAKLYNNGGSTTVSETVLGTGAALTSNLDAVNYGPVGSTVGETYWLDLLNLNDSGFPGPVTQVLSPTGVPENIGVGTPTIARGTVTVTPTGVPENLGVGEPSISIGSVTISPTGVESAAEVGIPTLSFTAVRYFLIPPDVWETPMAWNRLHARYALKRGIAIIQRQDDSFYTARVPSQTELEAAQAFWLGGFEHEITADQAADLTAAGFGEYVHTVEG